MAQSRKTKKGTSTKKTASYRGGSSGSRQSTAKVSAQAAAKRRQRNSLISAALAVILTAILIIGQTGALGTGIKSFFAGLFGFCAFIVPVVMIYIAIMAAGDKTSKVLHAKIIQSCVLLLLICAVSHVIIFGRTGDNTPANVLFSADYLKAYFDFTVHGWASGGVIGAFFGGLMLIAFDKPISLVISFVLIALFLLFVGSFGLNDCIDFFKRLFARRERAYDDEEDEDDIIIPAGVGGKTARVGDPTEESRRKGGKKDFDIDVDLGPGYAESKKKSKKSDPFAEFTDKSSGESGNVFDLTDEQKAADSEHQVKLDDLIKKLVEENAEEAPKKEDNNQPAIPVEIPEERLSPAAIEYVYPPITLLKKGAAMGNGSQSELKSNAERIVDTLMSFGIETRVLGISRGPAVTRYELQPSAGVKISRITSLADDIAMNLEASGVRIEAPIPGKHAIGIEVPNSNVDIVALRDVVDSMSFKNSKSKLTVAVGRDIAGDFKTADLAKMPHLLIAGATGSGKSVCINSFIISLLYKSTPDEVKLIMVDPKMVELVNYNGIPHLLIPVVTDARKAAGALNWAVSEMVKRYGIFSSHGVRDISSYNKLAEKTPELLPMSRIVIIIDEVEDAICRLAQLARAAGMHLVIATQRPSVNVITGTIKANVPSRVAFAVTSYVDSRTILDTGGAEKLLGRGDMLFAPIGSKPERIQGCFVSDDEISSVIDFVKSNYAVSYDEGIQAEIDRLSASDKDSSQSGGDGDSSQSGGDAKLMEAIEVVINAGSASTSLLQRKLSLGYARAAKIMDEMEERGIIGPAQGSKPRDVLMSRTQWLEMNMRSDEVKLGSQNADFGD